jgi:hypothetical protein
MKNIKIGLFSLFLAILIVVLQASCSQVKTSDTSMGSGETVTSSTDQESLAQTDNKPDTQSGGSGLGAISRIILLYQGSPYRLAGTKEEPTDLIAFQIRSVNVDGTIGEHKNFLPEYHIEINNANTLSIDISGVLADEFEELYMDISKSMYFNTYEKKIFKDHVSFIFTAKSSIKIKVVEYYLDFIDFYFEVSGD